MNDYDVIVLGGGAAGLMCALTAARRGRRVVVLDSSNKIGKKILMSGGGRCNFTNVHSGPQHFLSANPHFCKSALSRYTPQDFIGLVENHGIAYHEKTLGQLFCDNSSKDVLNMLTDECRAGGVEIFCDCTTSEVSSVHRYELATSKGAFSAPALVVATGGLSIPKMGASDFGYRVARQFGLEVRETRAGLVPLTFSGELHERFGRLSGVGTRVHASCGSVSFLEDMLFTHRGLSGPAILQVSSYWQPGAPVQIDLLPDASAADLLSSAKVRGASTLLRTLLGDVLPRALVAELQAMLWANLAETPIREIADARLRTLAHTLHSWIVKPAATEGYRTAEVTLGGVDTNELSSQTMECRSQPGLYFIGEVVDVTGHLGGHNFQWAWASAHAAGLVV